MTKPKMGKELRKVVSFRIEPEILQRIIDLYGSISNFINLKIKKDKNLKEGK